MNEENYMAIGEQDNETHAEMKLRVKKKKLLKRLKRMKKLH